VELVIVIAIVSALTALVLVAGGKMFSSKQEVIADTAIAIFYFFMIYHFFPLFLLLN
jgi:type II secretory pathway pseudopilin PulG